MAICYPVLSPDEVYLLSSDTLLIADFTNVTYLDSNGDLYSTYSGFSSNGLPILVGKSGDNIITIIYDIEGNELWSYKFDNYSRRKYPLITYDNNIYGNTYQYTESGSYLWFYDIDATEQLMKIIMCF